MALSVPILVVLLLAAAPLRPQDPGLRTRIAAALEAIPALDDHAHLLDAAPFDPNAGSEDPLLWQGTRPDFLRILRERFGVAWDATRPEASQAAAREARRALVDRLGGGPAYWRDHLRAARTEVVLVNQLDPEGTDGQGLRWVPIASPLLLPWPGALAARSPESAQELTAFRRALGAWLRAEGEAGPPATLEGYLGFLDRHLRRWQAQGAVALKFVEAYHRTLRFEPVSRPRAERLWRRARRGPLGRADTLALSDFFARHLFHQAGRLHLPVHLHTGLGGSRRLRLREADPLLLEDLISDPAFDGTDFVLIHAGAPDPRPAAALAAFKPNVWLDLSGLALDLPPAELCAALRACLLLAPNRVLYGTDAFGGFQIPLGAEVPHLALGAALRQALVEALASLVEDGSLDEIRALGLGRGVLRDNARRLYGWDR